MKDLPEIFARWDIGEFFGDNRPHGRVTVEPNWELNLLLLNVEPPLPDEEDPFPVPGNPINRVGPFRQFQSLDGPLTEVNEVPNIKSIQIDRSIDTDAASCTIVINNQWMDNNDGSGGSGDGGGLTNNNIWLVNPAHFPEDPSAGFFVTDGTGQSGFIFLLDEVQQIQSQLELLYGSGNVSVYPYDPQNPLPGTYYVEFIGELAGLNPGFTVTGVVGSPPALFEDQVGEIILGGGGIPGGLASQLGSPGYFTWNRGDSTEAQARWNHAANNWNNVLVPNALLRTYQGYGGYTDGVRMSLVDAIDGGFITITGTWIVDVVSVGTDGTVSLKCRDAAKLLMVQQLFPPLVPSTIGTLKYSRWIDTPTNTIWNPGAGLITNNQINWVPLTYGTYDGYTASMTDYLSGNLWPVGNIPVMGYNPDNVYNSNFEDFSVGNGWEARDGAHILDYWEAWVGTSTAQTALDINKVYVLPWFGPYTVYISVMEGDVWQGTNTIPYGAPGTNPGAAIPYVVSAGLSLGTTGDVPTVFDLPRTYHAQLIRVSLKGPNVSYLQDGTFRSGLREVRAGISAFSTRPAAHALAPHPSNGYWITDVTGQQFFFGDARELTQNGGQGISNPVVASVSHPTSPGYWTVESTGRVHAYGAAQRFQQDLGSLPTTDAEHVGVNDFIDIAVTHTGNGYWLLRRTGGVYSFGDAQYLDGIYMGNHYLGEIPSQVPIEQTAQAIVGHPSVLGYWLVDAWGHVGAYFGETVAPSAYHYGVDPDEVNSGITAMETTADGGGYWIMTSNGNVLNFGNAANIGQPSSSTTVPELGQMWRDLKRSNSPIAGQGFWALRADGRVSAHGATYHGAPGDAGSTIRTDGNYQDYVEIIFDLLAWSGFAYYDLIPPDSYAFGVIANLESTGAWSEEPISEDVFDKKPVIDAITTIKEIAGYLFWIDETGAAHFEPPNWWAPGNWFEDGTRTTFLPEIDEQFHLTEYGASFDDESMRSEIIISNSLPEAGNATTTVSRYVPPGQASLRNMVRPAMWVNEVFSSPDEQQVMAELIGMHIWFSQRQGSVSCSANPAIQINDQVRIWERVTAESYIHYVRGVSTRHDLETGVYEMNLTTHWMGSDGTWVIRPPGTGSGTDQNLVVDMSIALLSRLIAAENSTSPIVEAMAVV